MKISAFLLIFATFFTSIHGFWHRLYAVKPLKTPLEIQKTARSQAKCPLNLYPCEETPKKVFEIDFLHWLYQACETGDLTKVDHFDEMGSPIFEANSFYPYTPAEWAIYNRQNGIFRCFLENALDNKNLEYATVEVITVDLAAFAIKYRNLTALKTIYQVLGMDLRGKGLLSLAIQHLVDEEMLRFLLNEVKLIDEIVRAPPTHTQLRIPIDACIKFNNMVALDLILDRSPALLFSTISSIMTLNRQRLMVHLLDKYKELTHFSSLDRGSLFHAAVSTCRDANMINIIAHNTPNLDINALDKNDFSALSLSISLLIEFPERHRLPIFKALILNGADLFNSIEKVRPIDLILENGHIQALTTIVDCLWKNDRLMLKLMYSISRRGYWNLFDKVIEIYPRWIPLKWLYLNDFKVASLVSHNAYRTFHYLLESGYNFLKEEVIEALNDQTSEEFRNVAKRFLENK